MMIKLHIRRWIILFKIGDKIVYPMHGAGSVEAIEDKEIQGVNKQYYIIKLSINNLQIMIPVGNETKLGIRPVSDTVTLKAIMSDFSNGETDLLLPCKQRLKINGDKIKTGKIEDSAEVVRDLMRINKEKPLNSNEKQMLNNAKAILLSELVLIKGITENQLNSFSEVSYG